MTRVGARVHAWPVVVVHRWEIAQGTQMVGVLKLLRVQQPDLGEEYYQVQRPDGQICGEIDTRGCAWRPEPFKKEMVFIGMGTMKENCAKLLEVEGEVEVESWSEKAAAEASMRTEARKKATSTTPAKPKEGPKDAPNATEPAKPKETGNATEPAQPKDAGKATEPAKPKGQP